MARKDAEALILKYVDKLVPGGENRKLYEDLFSSMSNEEFDAFIKGLDDGSRSLPVIVPNDGKHKIDVKKAIKVAEELGVKIFTPITIEEEGMPPRTTQYDLMVIDLPFKRLAQLVSKKISVPEDTKTVSVLTGQPTGKSRGAKVSYPEIQVMASIGMKDSLVEVMKIRGGDKGAYRAFEAALANFGSVNQEQVEPYSTEVEVKKTVRAYLTAMHLRTTL